MNARYRPAAFALIAIVGIWIAAVAAYEIFQHSKMTAEKLRAYLTETDLSKLSGAARAKALRDLADKINALPPDERQRGRLDHLWAKWFRDMNEQEKSDFLEATMPSGFKQAIASFEKQPPDRRQKAIAQALQQLREDASGSSTNNLASTNNAGTNTIVLSDDLQKKVAMMGIQTVYSSSSAETKAELAPLLEEIQRNMESGRLFRQGR
jgi:hypothetical protein